MRTIRELAQEALAVQDACNLSGVAISFAKAVVDLRAALGDKGDTHTHTHTHTHAHAVNTHPIVTVWLSKLADLNDYRSAMAAFGRVRELAR